MVRIPLTGGPGGLHNDRGPLTSTLLGREASPPSGDTTGAIDTARLTALVAGGGDIILRSGTYWINATVVLPTRTRLRGAGNSAGIVALSIDALTITGNNVKAPYASGVLLATACTNVLIEGNVFKNSQTAQGIQVAGSSTGIVIQGNRCYDDQGTKTQGYGATIDGTCDYLTVIGNDFRGNVIADGLVCSATHSYIHGNRSHNPVGVLGPPAVPASTSAYTNAYGVDATVHVTGGTVTVIAVGGTTTGLTAGSFRVPANGTITVTYTVVPTWVWIGD